MTTTNVETEPASVCYRHPERPTGIRCQRCSKAMCPECMVAAPVGFHCATCVSEAAGRVRQIQRIGTGAPLITYTLIAVNVAVALASLASSPDWMQGEGGEVAVRGGLLGGGLTLQDGSPELIGVDRGEWYRIFTGAFIHGGLIHLFFNMLILWQAGSLLEGALGRLRFGALFVVSLLGGSFGALLVSPDALTVGASGGVFGLMGALFLAQRKGLVYSQGSSVGFLIVINLVLTVVVPGISIGGHIGGLAAGAAIGWAMFEFERRQLPSAVPLAISAGLGIVLFVGCLWAATFWLDPIV